MSSLDMPGPVDRRLGYALKRAQHALRIAMDGALRPLALTTPQYAVLCAIEAEAGLSNARLARAAFLTAQTMQGILTNLEKAGLIERRADPDHGRRLRSDLTRRGRGTLARAHRAVRGVEETLAASLGKTNVAAITAALTRCADDLQALTRST